MKTCEEIERLEAEIQHSKAKLSGKWTALKLELEEVAQSAREDVLEGIQNAKDTVSIRHQAKERPWVVFGGSVLAGVVLSPAFGVRGLALLGLTTPLMRNALAAFPAREGRNQAGSSSFDAQSDDAQEGQSGNTQNVRSKAIVSLVELARNLVRKNVHPTFAPIIEQAISVSTKGFLTPNSSVVKNSISEKRVINDKGESVSSVH